ncbi:TetR family transcriptional regulator [Agrococcus sp. ARC_14]|uniref:TetR/AcrR family transcriptional regulator n=1 Tax=Agrococcus sp. ARC_14 TaxID=2919927 RepID=UPI001F066F0F|nr:TetR family transcriptional regulator [Agrococcus sp. ARC_14]MCH1882432.1 TetR/AcrR family transcriptional regulator [Agrococcus sp. ARC_14]
MADDDVSRVVALAWGVAASPQRGPKRELSHERIVETAIEIADAEGLPAVTMQRVAQAFGFTTMAIYRYVATKDELHRLMLDAAFADRAAPDTSGEWREAVAAWIAWLFEGYRAHPWVLEIPLSMETLLMPRQMRLADLALHAMRDLPTTEPERLALLMSLSTYLRGMATIERDISGEGAVVSEATKALVREVATRAEFPSLAPLIESGLFFGETPPSATGEPDAFADVTPEDFAIGIHIWLEGIEAMFAGRDAPPQPPAAAAPETPAQQLARAEAELTAGVAARKAAEQRVKELYKQEAVLRKRRDSTKELAKAAERAERV